MIATLLRRGPRTCRSRQLADALSFPSTNQRACGGRQSSTRVHSEIQSSIRAWSSQKRFQSRPAAYNAAVAAARAANSAVAGNRRFSERSVSIWSVTTLPPFDGYVRPLLLADVDLARAGDLLILVQQHLLPLGQPAGHAAQR